MKLLSKEQIKALTPVKKEIYLRRLERYFGQPKISSIRPTIALDPEDVEPIQLWPVIDTWSGQIIWCERIELILDNANALYKRGYSFEECRMMILEEIGI